MNVGGWKRRSRKRRRVGDGFISPEKGRVLN